MKSFEDLIFERIEIRCAMWAAGFLTEEALDNHIENCVNTLAILHDGKPRPLTNSTKTQTAILDYQAAKHIVSNLSYSNDRLIEYYFNNEIL